jgi:hypothetical protein
MGGNDFMNGKVLAILLIPIVSLSGIPHVQANKNIFNKTCMATTSPPSWNKYGLDLRNTPAFDRNIPIQAMITIEPLDSDGDKFIKRKDKGDLYEIIDLFTANYFNFGDLRMYGEKR